MILLGINESGKSNILKAINSKDDKENINYRKDCNQEAENKQKSISISYSLTTSASWVNRLKSKGIPESLAKIIKFEAIERKVKVGLNVDRSDFFWTWVKDNKDFQKYVLFNNGIQLKLESTTELNENEEITNLLDKERLEEYLESSDWFSLFGNNTPKVIFWRAEDKYLINKSIDLNNFKQNTNISIPLRNCFNIAGIEQDYIAGAIDAIVDHSAKKSRLQRKLSEKVTEYINTVWPEHKTKISFDIDDMQLSFLVEDSDVTLDVSQRSDGFKQFISILLNLSIENETGKLKNKIILLDEPEIHLHPSGQKYLRDELLKISENNVVIYATHSIYMVDKKNLDRHYQVQKDNGLTTIKKVEKDNLFGDDILYKRVRYFCFRAYRA